MKSYLDDGEVAIHLGRAENVLPRLDEGVIDAVVTSPPYEDMRPEVAGVRITEWKDILRNLGRVMTPEAPMLLNVGRRWAGHIELRWWERILEVAESYGLALLDTRIWIKPNANPIHGEFLADSHEYIFVLGRPGLCTLNVDEARTPYAPGSEARLNRKWVKGKGVKGDDQEMIWTRREANELGARPRSFIEVYVGKEKGNKHPTPMPLELAESLVTLAAPAGATILDPFLGSGTTALAARRLGRKCIGIEPEEEWCKLAAERTGQLVLR